MKTHVRPVIALLLGLALLGGSLLQAAERSGSPANRPAPAPAPAPAVAPAPAAAAAPAIPPATAAVKPTPGVEAAQAVSTITGVAISPLLGVGAVGAWKYFKTPIDKRAGLPWFAQPWFWVPALLLVTIVFLKDTAGTALPTALKKPLDIAEVFENKISALVAAGAFVPLIATIFQSAADADSSLYRETMLAAFDPASLLNIIAVPVAIAVFLVVWMVSHVINVLIIISPFSTVDAALKSVRLALLSSVTLTSLANPYVGAAWALVIIVVSYFLAGWSLRLTVFGTVFAWDFLTFGSSRARVDPAQNRVFTAKSIDKTPIRSYGKLSRNEAGQFVLTYRPWLILPARQLVLPAGTYAVGRGLFFPEVIRIDGDTAGSILTLPPRYCGHEEEFARIYNLAGIQNIGIQALWEWFKGALRSRAAPA